MVAGYLAVLVTVIICVFARPIGEYLAVIDTPDGERKLHSGPTPLLGGIAIMAPLCAWSMIGLVSPNAGSEGLDLAILLCAGGVAVVGFMDDQRTISASGRLILLLIFSAIALRLDPILLAAGVHTSSWGWLLLSSPISAILIVVALTGFSSAVNFSDGSNGLVLSLVCVWSGCLALRADAGIVNFAQLLAACSFVTLLFNASGRLFLGDCGSFAVAFTLGLLTIECHNRGTLPIDTVIVWFLIPIVDCVRLIPLRIWNGRSPFRPDRRHFHHRLGARIGEARAIWCYVGLVGTTSLVATLKPQLSLLCISASLIVYLGFLLADVLAPPEAIQAADPRGANVVALERKQTSGRP